MLRFVVREGSAAELPALDIATTRVVIGSAPRAHVRLPAPVARGEHAIVEGGRWRAVGDLVVDGTPRPAGSEGEIGSGVALAIGAYRVAIAPAPGDAIAATAQRTGSIARELVRGLLGGDSAPALEVETGAQLGARRVLAPPDSVLVIGRGDDAGWILADDDLSRAHAEIRRTWDGVRIVDRGSKNGTRVDGVRVTEPAGAVLADNAVIELGPVRLRFRDPAERHLRGRSIGGIAIARTGTGPLQLSQLEPPPPPRSRVALVIALTIAVAAAAALIWLLAT